MFKMGGVVSGEILGCDFRGQHVQLRLADLFSLVKPQTTGPEQTRPVGTGPYRRSGDWPGSPMGRVGHALVRRLDTNASCEHLLPCAGRSGSARLIATNSYFAVVQEVL